MFIALAAISIVTAVILVFMHLPAIEDDAEESVTSKGRSAWSVPHLILGFVAIGVYMGLEVGVGNYFLNYVEYNVPGKTIDFAAKILGFYPLGFFVGRLLGAGLLKKYEASKVLLVNSIICVLLLVAFFMTKGTAFSIWPLIAQGLFLSIMWSVLFDLSMKDIPASAAKLGSGIICTGVIFTGMWMFIMGKVVDSTGTQLSEGSIDPASSNYGMA